MKILLMASLLLCLLLSGCTSGGKAQELFETAQFEEKQNNKPHAITLYDEVVANYPGTELAQRSKERLTELRQETK